MTRRIITALIIFGFIMAGFLYISGIPVKPGKTPLNAIYSIEGREFQLKNGKAEIESLPGAASKIKISVFEVLAKGDLNGDGFADNAVLLTYDGGGSGTFFYIAAAIKTASGYTGTNAILLGDRIAPQPTEIRDGEVIVNYAERKPDEPMTARPSVGVSRYFKIEKEKLVEINQVDQGILCTKESRNNKACIQVYQPVCATVQIQCIKAPCNPIKETFPSACEACGNPLVNSYLPGECR